MRIRSGKLKKDFFFVEEGNPERILNFVLSLYKDGLQKFDDYDTFKNVQIITPSKKGMIGTRELNKRIQELVNPFSKKQNEKSANGGIFREGDCIMQMKNNYDIEWEQDGEIGSRDF